MAEKIVKDSQGLVNDLVNDTISRRAAVDMILGQPIELHYPSWYAEQIKTLPSAQPYTDAEIQKIQDLEQTQFEKMYELGYQAGCAEQPEQRWIPCSEKEAEYPCLACDVFGQIFITNNGIVRINGECYDGTGFDFINAEEFLKGIKVGNSMRMLPRKIVAWSPLPEPYKGGEDE